jgi:hypothetical protein
MRTSTTSAPDPAPGEGSATRTQPQATGVSAPGRHGGRIGTRIRNQTVVVAGQHKRRSQPRNNTRGEIASDAIRHGLRPLMHEVCVEIAGRGHARCGGLVMWRIWLGLGDSGMGGVDAVPEMSVRSWSWCLDV